MIALRSIGPQVFWDPVVHKIPKSAFEATKAFPFQGTKKEISPFVHVSSFVCDGYFFGRMDPRTNLDFTSLFVVREVPAKFLLGTTNFWTIGRLCSIAITYLCSENNVKTWAGS